MAPGVRLLSQGRCTIERANAKALEKIAEGAEGVHLELRSDTPAFAGFFNWHEREDKTPKPFAYDVRKAAAETDEYHRCVCCGRAVEIATATLFVHVINGGSDYGGEAEETNEVGDTDAGDMGWFPVGSACARKLRNAGIFIQKLKKEIVKATA